MEGLAATGSGLFEEFELMKQAKYRVYMQNVDKALKNFEYSSEWADLIAALGKLNKVISSYPQYQVIPRRIKISKRLSQCMHPALPSGVHLKALETYDVIFGNTGLERLASELFIYSAGLFPLMQHAAMNVRPSLLEIYEKYFVPLGERLRPALSGFLSGVLPGLEAGLDHFDRTNVLLCQVCSAVSPIYFYTCLWECVATNSSIRLPAITFVIDHFNKRIGMSEQTYLIGRNVELMMSGLCACLNDSVILVQRNTLEFLLLGFPLHTTLLSQGDLTKLVTNGLNTILRRDMSLNRRVYSWLLGSEVKHVQDSDMLESNSFSSDLSASNKSSQVSYFEQYSKQILIQALKITLRSSIQTADLRPYKILLSLLDKVEIGPVVLDSILIDVIRTTALVDDCSEVKKSVNTLFGNFDPAYIWNFLTNQFEVACKLTGPEEKRNFPKDTSQRNANDIDSGEPNVIELSFLVECLLDILSLEMFNETTRVYLPRVLFAISKILTLHVGELTDDEVTASLMLCCKIVKHIQPMILESSGDVRDHLPEAKVEEVSVTFQEQLTGLEKSKSDSKLNQSAVDEPMKRSRSNHNMGGKKSPKKSKKSKSHSKLYELDKEICADSGHLVVSASNATSVPNLDDTSEKKGKKKKAKKSLENLLKTENIVESDAKTENKIAPIETATTSAHQTNTERDKAREAQLQKYTVLEKCSKQYEVFFQLFLASRLLHMAHIKDETKCPRIECSDELSYFLNDDIIECASAENLTKIDELFASLKIARTSRDRKLQSLLHQSIGESDEMENSGSRQQQQHSNESLRAINKLLELKLSTATRRSVKHLTQLLVTFSTIPNYDQTVLDECEEECDVPPWLKALSIIAAFSKSDKELQITSITTLFELIDIVKSQRKEKLPSNDVKHLIMLPLLKHSHVAFLEDNTRVFQVLVSTLWDYLDPTVDVDLAQITVLIYRLHSCLEGGLVERTISDRIENAHLIWTSSEVADSDLEEHDDRLSLYKLERLDDIKIMLNFPRMSATNCSSQLTERQSSGFRKFEMLWHLGRDQKECFERILLKVYDNLATPQHTSIRTFVVKWLKESLLRGDLGRLLMPLLKIMLNPNTKRISVSNLHLLKTSDEKKRSSERVFDDRHSDEKELQGEIKVENEVYVIKTDDGHVMNHLESLSSKKKSPINTIQKKIISIANKGANTSEKMRERGLMPLTKSPMVAVQNTSDVDINAIGLIVNPLEQQGQEPAALVSKSAPTSIRESMNERVKQSPSIESSSEYSTTSADSMSDNEMSEDERVRLSGRIEERNRYEGKVRSYNVTRNESDTNDDSAISQTHYDESGTAADEYFSQTLVNEEDKSIEDIQKSVLHDLVERAMEQDDEAERETQSDENECEEHRQARKRKPRKVGKKITRETLEKGKKNVKILRKNLNDSDGFFPSKMEKLHSFHTHLLLYHSCYDTKRILYCLETLRNLIVAGNPKLFMCLSINTSVSDTQLKHLLIRHRKSIFGKGFDGSLTNTEFNNAYRGVMLVEVLITLCLYYARSYFQLNQEEIQVVKEESDEEDEGYRTARTQHKVTSEEILANCKIQLAAIEMLHLMFTELIAIVKEMGKGLASYIADLMTKCKVQKVILHCVLTSVHYATAKIMTTSSEKILKFNDPGDSESVHLEAIQIQLLKLLDAVIKLEHETIVQRGEDIKESTVGAVPRMATSSILSQSPTRPKPMTSTTGGVKYIQNLTISQQPMFLSAVLNALLAENLKHLHKNWTELVTSSLNCFSPDALSNIVVSIMHQLCENIDNITGRDSISQVSSDYIISQLEALTVICHFCLLDNNQQVSLSHLFNPQNTSLSAQSSSYGQIYNNILNFFLSSSPLQVGEAYNKHQLQQNATRTCVLSHLPRIISSMAPLLETQLGQERLVRQQLMEFITPIALHHGCNFLAAIAVVWHERSDKKLEKNTFKFQQPANEGQLSLIRMVTGIKVMPFDSFVQTLNSVIKSPPQIYRPPAGLVLNVSALEFFYVYIKSIKSDNLNDSWTSLLNLLRDSINLSPPAQFMLFCILYEIVKECSPYDRKDKKDIRDLHDITIRLIDVISNIAGSCLEQTTWLRRNLAVTDTELTANSGNQQFTVEAQSILGHILVNLLDYAFGSQEKDKITQIVTTLMYNIIPYLKNHTPKNVPFFYACSNLLSTLTPYQYTRKAWRKDVFDLFLDPTFFQIDISCLPFWKQILDNLMSYDNITFRELMSRLSVAPAGSLNIFTSKEQEYEQKAMLLKKLAFVIFCSEKDQYQKYMPEIQEQLSTCLRLPQVIPCVQAAVLLCFRVLLLRMSPDHVTSLWPTIIAEMVQVFLAIEQELMTDTEEFRTHSSQHIRMLSGLDTAWVTNTSNGLHAQNHPSWRMVQLETAKLLELGCVLPASVLPHFQMYRWAFVGSQHDYCSSDIVNGTEKDSPQFSKFIPHVTRIAQLMDFRYTTHSPANNAAIKGSHLVLTYQTINTLQDLYGFFSTLCIRWPNSHHFNNSNPEKDVKGVLSEIEQVLSLDFLEKMPISTR